MSEKELGEVKEFTKKLDMNKYQLKILYFMRFIKGRRLIEPVRWKHFMDSSLMARGTLNKHLGELLKGNYITKKYSKQEGYDVYVLTAKGKRLIEKAYPRGRDVATLKVVGIVPDWMEKKKDNTSTAPPA